VDGGIIEFTGANIVNNAANITLNGATASIRDQNNLDGLRGFNDNMATGMFTLEGGANFNTAGIFGNNGLVDIFASDAFTAGSLYAQGAGTTQVDGNLTAATVNVAGGRLKGTGTVKGNVMVSGGAEVDPGDSPGTLNVNGNYTQTATGVLNLEFAGPGAGQFDVLNVSGNANLAGTLDLTALAGFTPVGGESFDVLNYGSRTGTFTSVNGLNLGSGYTFQLQYNANDLVLTVNNTQAAPEPGSRTLFACGVGIIAVSRFIRRKVQ
jgi:hypothetical protein